MNRQNASIFLCLIIGCIQLFPIDAAVKHVGTHYNPHKDEHTEFYEDTSELHKSGAGSYGGKSHDNLYSGKSDYSGSYDDAKSHEYNSKTSGYNSKKTSDKKSGSHGVDSYTKSGYGDYMSTGKDTYDDKHDHIVGKLLYGDNDHMMHKTDKPSKSSKVPLPKGMPGVGSFKVFGGVSYGHNKVASNYGGYGSYGKDMHYGDDHKNHYGPEMNYGYDMMHDTYHHDDGHLDKFLGYGGPHHDDMYGKLGYGGYGPSKYMHGDAKMYGYDNLFGKMNYGSYSYGPVNDYNGHSNGYMGDFKGKMDYGKKNDGHSYHGDYESYYNKHLSYGPIYNTDNYVGYPKVNDNAWYTYHF